MREKISDASEQNPPELPKQDENISRRNLFKNIVRAAPLLALSSAVHAKESPDQQVRVTTEKNQEHSSQFRKYEPLELHGQKIEFCGVRHNPSTLEVYERELRDAIERSSLVVLEGAPEAEGIFEPQYITAISAWAKRQGVTLSDSEIIDALRRDPDIVFFSGVERMAKEASKRIAIIDPLQDSLASESLLDAGKNTEIKKALVLLGGYFGYAGTGILNLLAKRTKQEPEKLKNKKGTHLITRRKALQGLFALTSSTSLLSLLASAHGIQGMGSRRDNPFGLFVHNISDYRDVSVATGIDELAKTAAHKDPITVIYGNAHINSQRHYLVSPQERKARSLGYGHFQSIKKPLLKVFEPVGDYWQKVTEQKI